MSFKFFLWFNSKRRAERDQDLHRELRSHIDADAEEQAARGISEHQARRAALLQFGNPALAAEATRDAWGWAALDRISQDIRFTFRSLRKNLGYTALAVAILALGIGANTAIFSAVNAALLRPLPFPHAEQLVELSQTPPGHPDSPSSVSRANFLEWAAQQDVFDAVALCHFHGLNLTSGDHPDFLPGAEVSEQFFAVFQMEPLLGRVFTVDEMQPGHDREVVLSFSAWKANFGGDPKVVGQQFSFDRQGYTIIGVMPEQFQHPHWDAKIWVPIAWTPADHVHNAAGGNSIALARLKPSVSVRQAQAEMSAIAGRIARTYPAAAAGWGAIVMPLQQYMTSELRAPLLILFCAVAFVLLIAGSDVANLVLAKSVSRRKEIAIRGALGASRRRVLQLVLTESVLLGLGAGAVGLLLARYTMQLISAYLGDRLPKLIQVRLDSSVLTFAIVISILCGISAGILPALRFTRSDRDLHTALKEGLGHTDAEGGGVRSRDALVIMEVALCMMLLISAGLLVRTLWALQNIDPGFNWRNVITLETPHENQAADDHNIDFVQQSLARLNALPGVQAVGATINIPLSGSDEQQWPVQLPDQPPQPAVRLPVVAAATVTPGYFAALQIPLLRGRDFSNFDTADRPAVVVISQAMAERFWPGQDPIGKRLVTRLPVRAADKMREVIGVVGNTKDWGLERSRPLPLMYIPFTQGIQAPDSFLIRTALPTDELAPAATRAIHAIDRNQPVVRIQPLLEIVADSYADRRANMLLLVAFAGLALALAVAGIYGVLSYNVRRRLREIGIRVALGANVRDVLRLVVLEGMKPTLVGVALGIAGALALGRVMQTMIFGVKPTDVRTYAAVAALLSLVSLVACLIPAYRATRVQPLDVLRDE